MSDPKITPFLMFIGKAEEAMHYYTSIFADSAIISIERYGAGEIVAEGKVKLATFKLHGQLFRCIDSSDIHAFTFTPSISFYVTCDTEAELDRTFAQLAQDGAVLMPLDTYPFSQRYGWVQDKFGVSWQLSL